MFVSLDALWGEYEEHEEKKMVLEKRRRRRGGGDPEVSVEDPNEICHVC